MRDLLEEIKTKACQEHLPILRDAERPLLEGILSQKQPHRILEIGTCIGYSALLMAPFLSAGGTLTTLELDPVRCAQARSYFSRSVYKHVICSLNGDAAVLLETLKGPWDFVFLDGPKGQYLHYLQLILPQLAPGALIVADDVRYHDMMYIDGTLPHKHRTAVTRLRQFLKLLAEPHYFESVFFENGDGLVLSQWKG